MKQSARWKVGSYRLACSISSIWDRLYRKMKLQYDDADVCVTVLGLLNLNQNIYLFVYFLNPDV